jgi:hypothetical protein
MRKKSSRKEEIQKALDEVFSVLNMQKLQKDYAKALEGTTSKNLTIRFNRGGNNFEVKNRIEKGDAIEFEENDMLRKAVVTALGRDGVTVRDEQHRKLCLYYRQIKNYKKQRGLQ